MRGCRHSGVRVIVPPRRASMPMRVTCRYLKRDKLSHPPPLMEGEALASRILELGPVGAKFLGPVMIEVPHFGSLRGKEREIVILRSDNGETWREHTVDCSEDAVQDVLSHSFDKEDIAQLEESSRTTRILTTDFPHYFAVVTRVRQEVHAIGPEGGMVSSSVVPQVQAVFPQGALTKKIKVGLQAQPISAELAAKLLGNRVAVSPIVTVEPRRRKFHKPITLTIPKPQTANKGMINQYSGDAPTLRLLCSITGGTTRAQWEDVTGSTPFTFVNDCVSFTTTVSARFWLMDCRNVGDATKMATELYREAIHVPFMAKFVVFAKRVDPLEARLRIFCMTDDKEDKTLEHQEHFTEVAKSRDVEVLEGKTQYIEFAGNLVPVTKSGEQLQLGFRAFRENRLPFTVRVKDPHADCIGRTLFMREARLPKGEPPQQPICVLNIVLPEEIIPEAILPEHELHKYSFIQDSSGLESYQRVDLRLSDISNLLGGDWVRLADELGVSPSDINRLKSEHPQSVAQQGLAMLRFWLSQAGNKAQASTLESALSRLGRDDIVQQCVFNVDQSGLQLLKDESRDASLRRSIPYSDKDIMKDSESVEDISRIPHKKSGEIPEKDDKEERKYEAEEKEVDEAKKSVLERRKEIEKRLSLDSPLVITETKSEKITIERQEDLSEKEIAEEKRVSSPEEEPSEMSFAQKRLSFEQGKRVIEMKPDKTTMKEVKERADERLLAEERKAAEALEQKKSMVDETSIPFEEKRKSFEQGSSEEKEKETKEDKKKEDIRRDSALFEGVSQGLVRLDAAFAAALQVQDLLSPKVSKTPPPSPAEFKDLTGTVAWTEDTSTPVVPAKLTQSQDWAEKGKPDATVDSSNKDTVILIKQIAEDLNESTPPTICKENRRISCEFDPGPDYISSRQAFLNIDEILANELNFEDSPWSSEDDDQLVQRGGACCFDNENKAENMNFKCMVNRTPSEENMKDSTYQSSLNDRTFLKYNNDTSQSYTKEFPENVKEVSLRSQNNSSKVNDSDLEETYTFLDTRSNTESFSELRFSVSESQSEFNYSDSDSELSVGKPTSINKDKTNLNDHQCLYTDNFNVKTVDDTTGILYEMSEQINKVPKLLVASNNVENYYNSMKLKKYESSTLSVDTDDSLEHRVLQYFSQCNKTKHVESKANKGEEELKRLEAAVERMLNEVEIQENLLIDDVSFVPLVLEKKEAKAFPLLVDTLCLSPKIQRGKIKTQSNNDNRFNLEGKKFYSSNPELCQSTSMTYNNKNLENKESSFSISDLEKSVNKLLNEVEKEEQKLNIESPDSKKKYMSTSITDLSLGDDNHGVCVWWEGTNRSLQRYSTRKKLSNHYINTKKRLNCQNKPFHQNDWISNDSDTSAESVRITSNTTQSQTKLMVKTVENGKCAIEIRTCNNFSEGTPLGSNAKFSKIFNKDSTDSYSYWNRSLPSLSYQTKPSLSRILSLGSDDTINSIKYVEASDRIQYFTPCPSMNLDSKGYCTWAPRYNEGESTRQEMKKDPSLSTAGEGEEALLDLATGLQETSGSVTVTPSAPSGTK